MLVSIGPKTSLVNVYGGQQRRIPNHLLHPEAGCHVAAERYARGLLTTTASGRGWLPGWSWLGWTIAQHLEYLCGQRQLPAPPPAPQRLVIVACGARKADRFEAPAGEMYTGSYHRAARRAADAIAAPGTRVMILSARYGLLDLDDVILRYDARLGTDSAISGQGLREQAEQLGLAGTSEVVVLAPAAYADLAAQVWPHAQRPLAGTRGIGDQMARLTALANRQTTVTDLLRRMSGTVDPAPRRLTGPDSTNVVSLHGGRIHLAATAQGRDGVAGTVRPTNRSGRRWTSADAPITCTRCIAVAVRRRALDRWCALLDHGGVDTATETGVGAGAARVDGPTCDVAAAGRDRAGCTGRGPNRPGRRTAGHRGPQTRPVSRGRPGGPSRRRNRDGWRPVPVVPPPNVPLVLPKDPVASRDPSRRRASGRPRPPIGRAPPGPTHTRRDRLRRSARRRHWLSR